MPENKYDVKCINQKNYVFIEIGRNFDVHKSEDYKLRVMRNDIGRMSL